MMQQRKSKISFLFSLLLFFSIILQVNCQQREGEGKEIIFPKIVEQAIEYRREQQRIKSQVRLQKGDEGKEEEYTVDSNGNVATNLNEYDDAASKEEEFNDDTIDLTSLYKIAKEWLEMTNLVQARRDGQTLFHYLADEHSHVPSMIQLGHLYSNNQQQQQQNDDNIQLAIRYFVRAGQEGPHHSSLYNAGLLLIQTQDWVAGLAFLQAAATFDETTNVVDASILETARTAHETTCRQLGQLLLLQQGNDNDVLTLKQVADIFWYATLTPNDDGDNQQQEHLWTQAMWALVQVNETSLQLQNYKTALQALDTLWQQQGLADLQSHLLLVLLHDVLVSILSLQDDEETTLQLAAHYAHTLATKSSYCFEFHATTTEGGDCFNRVMSRALSYARQLSLLQQNNKNNDLMGTNLQPFMQSARNHPHAATKWQSVWQTPRIYYNPTTSHNRPVFWNPRHFSTVTSLLDMKQTTSLWNELNRLQQDDNQFQRAGTIPRYLGEHNYPTLFLHQQQQQDWTEFGPLFHATNGWNQDYCSLTPSLCRVIQQDDESLCRDICGTDNVVSVISLQSTDTVIAPPQCGPTNRRLIMYYTIVPPNNAAAGVLEITVRQETKRLDGKNGNNVLVFDDSYHHSVVYRPPSNDAPTTSMFLVVAVLKHPDFLAQE